MRVEATLEPGARAEGRVLRGDGTPVAGAQVWVQWPGHPEPGAVTAEDGTFVIETLEPGVRHWLWVRAEGLPRAIVHGFATGERLDVTLAAAEVEGRARTAAGGPPVGPRKLTVAGPLCPSPAGAEWWPLPDQFNLETDAAGLFRLTGLAPGRYRFEPGGEERDLRAGRNEVEVRLPD